MHNQGHRGFLVSGILILLLFVTTTSAQTPGPRVEQLSLGLVSEKPREKIEEHLDFVNYLALKLFAAPEIKGRVVVAGTALQLAKLLNEKQVDFYMESAYPTFLINERTGASVLLRRWKGGVGEYRSLLLTRRDSGIVRLEDLLGKLIVFEDPGSTSGYFLPKAFLIRSGFRLSEKFSFQASVSPKEIGYLFAHGSEANVINWVLLKRVAAGAFSSNDFDKLDEKRKADIVVLAETETVPRHLLSVRKNLDPAIVRRLKEVLLSMHLDDEGQRILQKTDKTTKFDLLPGGEQAMYRKIRELFRFLQGK